MKRLIAAESAPLLNRRDWLIAAIVLAMALGLRWIFLFTSPDRAWPHSVFYEGDAPVWVEWANALDRGEAFEFDLPLRSPAVAFLLSWIHPGLIEGSLTPFKALWCMFTALAAPLVYLAVRMQFSRRIAFIAAALYTFSFGSHVLSTSLNNEAIYTLLLMLVVLFTLRFARSPSFGIAMILGALHGLAMLTRFEHLLLLGLMILYSAGILFARSAESNRFTGALRLAVVVIAAVVVCLPWSIRGSLATQRFNTISADVPDYEHASPPWSVEAREFLDSLPAFAREGNFRFITHLAQLDGKALVAKDDVIAFFTQRFNYVPEPLSHWTLLSLKGPVDFALANHPAAGGGFSKAALMMPGETDPTIRFGRPDHLCLFNEGYTIGWQYITADFGGWLGRVATKLGNFFDGATLGLTSRNLPPGLEGTRRPVDLVTSDKALVWRALIFILIGSGALLCIIRRQGGIWLLIIVYKLIVTILFYGYARQAASILPAFFVLIAVAIDQAVIWIGSVWKPQARLAAIAASLALVILVAIDISGSIWRPTISVSGTFRFTPRWGEEAFESFETIRLKPTETGP